MYAARLNILKGHFSGKIKQILLTGTYFVQLLLTNHIVLTHDIYLLEQYLDSKQKFQLIDHFKPFDKILTIL